MLGRYGELYLDRSGEVRDGVDVVDGFADTSAWV